MVVKRKRKKRYSRRHSCKVVPNGQKNAAYLETVRRQHGAGSIGTFVLFFFLVFKDVDRCVY